MWNIRQPHHTSTEFRFADYDDQPYDDYYHSVPARHSVYETEYHVPAYHEDVKYYHSPRSTKSYRYYSDEDSDSDDEYEQYLRHKAKKKQRRTEDKYRHYAEEQDYSPREVRKAREERRDLREFHSERRHLAEYHLGRDTGHDYDVDGEYHPAYDYEGSRREAKKESYGKELERIEREEKILGVRPKTAEEKTFDDYWNIRGAVVGKEGEEDLFKTESKDSKYHATGYRHVERPHGDAQERKPDDYMKQQES